MKMLISLLFVFPNENIHPAKDEAVSVLFTADSAKCTLVLTA